MKNRICQYCKHWKDAPELQVTSKCKIDMVIGPCFNDYSCAKWEYYKKGKKREGFNTPAPKIIKL